MKSYLYFKRNNNHQVKKQAVFSSIISSIVADGSSYINVLPFLAGKIYLSISEFLSQVMRKNTLACFEHLLMGTDTFWVFFH